MKNSLVFGVILGLVFVFIVSVGTLGLVVLFYFSAQSEPVQARSAEVVLTQPDVETVAAALPLESNEFPPAPSKDGTQIEHWDGYYFYSLQSFEQALENNVERVHFWFEARRNAHGSFTAECEENAPHGASRIEGSVDRLNGDMAFTKQYVPSGAGWRYDGQWMPGRRRIEGTYGPNQGGFVLYPRRLTDAELAGFERRNPPDLPPRPAATPKPEERRVF